MNKDWFPCRSGGGSGDCGLTIKLSNTAPRAVGGAVLVAVDGAWLGAYIAANNGAMPRPTSHALHPICYTLHPAPSPLCPSLKPTNDSITLNPRYRTGVRWAPTLLPTTVRRPISLSIPLSTLTTQHNHPQPSVSHCCQLGAYIAANNGAMPHPPLDPSLARLHGYQQQHHPPPSPYNSVTLKPHHTTVSPPILGVAPVLAGRLHRCQQFLPRFANNSAIPPDPTTGVSRSQENAPTPRTTIGPYA